MTASRSNGHSVDLNPMEFIEQNGSNTATSGSGAGPGNGPAAPGGNGSAVANNGTPSHHHMPPFELDFDKFDMLGEFPDLDHYNNPSGAMIHHGASGPLLSSAISAASSAAQQLHQTQPLQTAANINKQLHHQHRHSITDYSPEWAWSDVSSLIKVWQLIALTNENFQLKDSKISKIFKIRLKKKNHISCSHFYFPISICLKGTCYYVLYARKFKTKMNYPLMISLLPAAAYIL